MKEEQDRKADEFIRKLVVEAGADQPSDQFTQSLMKKIGQEQLQSSVTRYQPLISKKGWLPIAATILGICFILLTGDWQQDWSAVPIPFLDEIGALFHSDRYAGMLNMNSISVDHTVVYALLMLSFFFYIQIIYLKKFLR
ncbi:MAG: hypothetical protein ABF293_11560 [Flavobacteriaceae bacterium]